MPRDLPLPSDDDLRALAQGFLELEGPLLPILHAIQDTFGVVPDNAARVLGDVLNVGRAEVHGVLSFYHDFRKAPAGTHVVRICRAEACQSMGGVALAEAVLAHFRTGWHGTTEDGQVTVEPVFCLGLCACAPAAMVDDRLIGRATVEKIAEGVA
ncbi:formate dehydrogenase subunit gamma [Mesobacterium sp. TK19101]|uniref:Formate dehydrogenase subunit gamma n=1 Tax=Mesobacterium hydrothermale TaxID=3111907 RepID=A0ABU6HJS4_9RHOB|nr:formate dehydrogenase subunit gamma [Mesobacterium sp. TK19101]MEC3861698.1 formate dehydrogenase subunit gamma [Mesobacterium sp. TK19101]